MKRNIIFTVVVAMALILIMIVNVNCVSAKQCSETSTKKECWDVDKQGHKINQSLELYKARYNNGWFLDNWVDSNYKIKDCNVLEKLIGSCSYKISQANYDMTVKGNTIYLSSGDYYYSITIDPKLTLNKIDNNSVYFKSTKGNEFEGEVIYSFDSDKISKLIKVDSVKNKNKDFVYTETYDTNDLEGTEFNIDREISIWDAKTNETKVATNKSLIINSQTKKVTITIPQEIFNNYTYPIYIDPSIYLTSGTITLNGDYNLDTFYIAAGATAWVGAVTRGSWTINIFPGWGYVNITADTIIINGVLNGSAAGWYMPAQYDGQESMKDDSHGSICSPTDGNGPGAGVGGGFNLLSDPVGKMSGGGGGGYGGAGGNGGWLVGANPTGGASYGSATNFSEFNFGSSGGSSGGFGGTFHPHTCGVFGRQGGGMVKLKARIILINNTGSIEVSGRQGDDGGFNCGGSGANRFTMSGSSGGAGGQIVLIGGIINASSGSLNAKGGRGGNGAAFTCGYGSSTGSGGGGGGRIKIAYGSAYYPPTGASAAALATGGTGGTGATAGGDGTYYTLYDPTLYFYSYPPNFTVDLRLVNNRTATLCGEKTFNSLVLINSTIRVDPMCSYLLVITRTNISIDENSSIDGEAAANGYQSTGGGRGVPTSCNEGTWGTNGGAGSDFFSNYMSGGAGTGGAGPGVPPPGGSGGAGGLNYSRIGTYNGRFEYNITGYNSGAGGGGGGGGATSHFPGWGSCAWTCWPGQGYADNGAAGGYGGATISLISPSVFVKGNITSSSGAGGNGGVGGCASWEGGYCGGGGGGGGGGAGGSGGEIIIDALNVNISNAKLITKGGAGGSGASGGNSGGGACQWGHGGSNGANGPGGRIKIFWTNSLSNTSVQTIVSSLDPLQNGTVYYSQTAGLDYFYMDPSVTLNYPTNGYVNPYLNVTFNCSAYAYSNKSLTNISFWTNETTWKINQTQVRTGKSNESLFVFNTALNYPITWTCSACDDSNYCTMGANYTYDTNPNAPTAIITLPQGLLNWGLFGRTQQVNYTIFDRSVVLPQFNLEYDRIDDSVVNTSLWSISYAGTCGRYVSEDNNYITIYSRSDTDCYYPGSATLTSNNLSDFYKISNISFYVEAIADCYQIGGGGGTCYYQPGYTYVYIFGNLVDTLIAPNSRFINYTINRIVNNSGIFFSVYKNGIYNMTIIPINNELQFRAEGQYLYGGGYLRLYYVNYTLDDWTYYTTNFGTCILNYNNTNTTINCAANTTTIIPTTQRNLTIFANNTVGVMGSTIAFWDYVAFQNSHTYNTTTYETATETFSTNVTATGGVGITSAELIYDGVNHTASVSNYGPFSVATVSIIIPNVVNTENKSFYWSFDGGASNSSLFNQTVNPMKFQLCNQTFNVSYMNVTYKDEITTNYVNASVDSSWLYSLNSAGTGAELYTYITSNENMSHQWCFSPSDRRVYFTTAGLYRYTALGYWTKTWYPALSGGLTNATTHQTLWMLSQLDGSAVTFQIFDTNGLPVSDARVSTTRTIAGAVTTTNDGYTDSTGAVTYYLSPLFVYQVSVSKTSCTTYTTSISPSTNLYTIVISCGGSGGGTGVTNYSYASNLDGLTFQRGPKDGVNYPGSYVFDYYLKSVVYNITKLKFELYNNNALVLSNETIATVGSSYCNMTSCLLTLHYNVASGDNMKAKYYADFGYGWNLIEGDAYWRFIVLNQNDSAQAFNRISNNIKEFFDAWGQSSVECGQYINQEAACNANGCRAVNDTRWDANPLSTCTVDGVVNNYCVEITRCIPLDAVNKQEFNRILTVFFFMVIVLFILGKFGYEAMYPGSFTGIVWVMIFICSMFGLFNLNGLTTNAWLNQYMIALVTFTYTAGFILSTWRRYSG